MSRAVAAMLALAVALSGVARAGNQNSFFLGNLAVLTGRRGRGRRR
jgi:hypothetical protein